VGGFGFLILIVIFGLVWFLLLVPARRRRTAHIAMQDSIEVGDEIITAGGLHAYVTAIDGDLVWIEIADGVVAKLDRRAVAAVARDVDVEVEKEQETPSEDLPPAG
jgi:preprotein translocase subunit YajC